MKKLYFKDIGLDIELKPFINIIGLSGSGKTHLLNNLINKINSNNIYLDDKSLKDYDLLYLQKNIAAALKTQQFNTEYVKEELLFYQLKININEKTAYKNIDSFVKFFGLEDIIESKIEYLTEYEK